MKIKNLILIAVFFVCVISAKTFAALASGSGGVSFYYGLPTNVEVESYSSVFPEESYQTDSGLPIYDPWQPITASTNISNLLGSASSSVMAPYYVAYNSAIEVQSQTNSFNQSYAWASVMETDPVTSSSTLDFGFSYSYNLEMDSGSEGLVRFYLGLWEGLPENGSFLLTAKDSWNLIDIGTESNPFTVLSRTFYTGYNDSDGISWSFPTPTLPGEYSYYVKIETQVIPEPATILLLLMGLAGLRKTRLR